jgi:Lon protease-like protein
MPEEVSIRVNFSRPMPLFPLGQVVMLPQQITPLHIFEPRYRQMVSRALDGSGQIALAKIAGSLVTGPTPPLRPAVCVGQIVQHESLDDGRYNIILQGVCRARIVEEDEADEDRMYRQAMLEPVGDDEPESLRTEGFRDWLRGKLDDGELARLAAADELLKLVANEEIPSPVLVEIISFALVTDDTTRYALLAEGSLDRRTRLVQENLDGLAALIRKAVAQKPGEWPKGTSWN